MKILQIATQVPLPVTDGGKLSVFGITKNLSQKGHDVDFVCYRKHDNYLKSIDLLKPYCTPYILDVQTDNSVISALINIFSPIPYNASKYKSKKLKKFIKNYFKEKDVDIIQIEHLHLGWLAPLLQKVSKAPIILRSQNLEMRIMKRFAENQKKIILKYFAKIQYKKFIKFEPLICSKFDLCIMISRQDEIELKKLNPAINTKYIPAGIDTSLLEYKKKEEIAFSLVHIGHTDWLPNYDSLKWFLSDIMPRLINQESKIHLYVYGGGNTKDFPVPQNVKDNVTIVGFVDNIWKEVLEKELAVVPLRIGGGIRIKILEMLAVGENIITTSIGKEGIDIFNEQEVLIADDADNFVKKILNFFSGKHDKDRMRINGKEFIKNNYTWNEIIKRFEAEYTYLLMNRGKNY